MDSMTLEVPGDIATEAGGVNAAEDFAGADFAGADTEPAAAPDEHLPPPAKKRGRPKKNREVEGQESQGQSQSPNFDMADSPSESLAAQSSFDQSSLSFNPTEHAGENWFPVSESSYSWGIIRTEATLFGNTPYATTNKRVVMIRTVVVTVYGSVGTTFTVVEGADIYDIATKTAVNGNSPTTRPDGSKVFVNVFKGS